MSDLKSTFSRSLYAAACSGHVEVVQVLLLDARVDPQANDNCAVVAAAAAGQVHVMEVFLSDTRVDEVACNLALQAASEKGQLPVVEMLLADVRVDPSAAHPDAAVSTGSHKTSHVRQEWLHYIPEWSSGMRDDTVHDEALRLAALGGHLAVVNRLLADPRVTPFSRLASLPLEAAVFHGHADVVRRLLADPRVQPRARQDRLLHTAAARGHIDVVRALLADGRLAFVAGGDKHAQRCASVWQQINNGGRAMPPHADHLPIAAAAEAGHLDIVELLLADPRLSPADCGNHALALATASGHQAVAVRLLRDPRVQRLRDKSAMLLAAASLGKVHLLSKLLALPAVNLARDAVFNAVKAAAAAGHLGALQLLMASPGVVQADAAAALMRAAAGGNVASLNLLINELGVDPSIDDSVSIVAAARGGHMAALERLLQDDRVNPGAADNLALTEAAGGGHAAIVAMLLAHALVDPADNDNAALIAACEGGHTAVVELLLADPRVDPTAQGNEAIKVASGARSAAIQDMLLARPEVRRTATRDAVLPELHSAGRLLRLLDDHHDADAGDGRDDEYRFIDTFRELRRRLVSLECLEVLTADARFNAAEVVSLVCTALTTSAKLHHLESVKRLVSDPRLAAAPERELSRAIGSVLVMAACRGDVRWVQQILSDSRLGSTAQAALHKAVESAAYYGRLQVLDCLLAEPRTRLYDPSSRCILSCVASEDSLPWRTAALQRLLAHARADSSSPFALPAPLAVVFEGEAGSAHGSAGTASFAAAGAVAGAGRSSPELIRAFDRAQLMWQVVSSGEVAIAAALLQDPRIIDTDASISGVYRNNTGLLSTAAGRGQVAVLDLLLADPRFDAGALGDQPLSHAATQGHLAAVDRLLADPRIDPAAGLPGNGTTAAHWAAHSGEVGVLDRLLADPRVFADQCNGNGFDALDAGMGHPIDYLAPEYQGDLVAGDRLGVCRRLLLETTLLHARLQRAVLPVPASVEPLARLGVDVAGLGQRAWLRRRAVVLARARALGSFDTDDEV